MARMVATKAALSIRIDALTDADGKSEPMADSMGVQLRTKLESRLRALVHQSDMNGVKSFSAPARKQQKFEMNSGVATYNTASDAVGLVSTQREPVERALQAVIDVKEEKRKAKEERRAKRKAEKLKEDTDGLQDVSMVTEADSPTKSANGDKKEKKRKIYEVEDADSKVHFFHSYI